MGLVILVLIGTVFTIIINLMSEQYHITESYGGTIEIFSFLIEKAIEVTHLQGLNTKMYKTGVARVQMKIKRQKRWFYFADSRSSSILIYDSLLNVFSR